MVFERPGDMSWAIGYDSKWKRDIGYGVPAYCDFPGCMVEIDRGLSHVCGGAPYGGDKGCGLYFCINHLLASEQLCDCCYHAKSPFTPTHDHPRWLAFKRTDPSWAAWRAEHPDFMANLTHIELCQQKLLALQSAIDEHTTEMDALMRRPASLDRGRAIGNLTNLLAQARRESELNCSPSKAISTSSPSAAPRKATLPAPAPSSSTAVSTRRPRKRKPR